MLDLGSHEFLVALSAFKAQEASPHFPVESFPHDSLLSDEMQEFMNIEILISNMFGNNVAMEVNKDFSFGTHHPFVLTIGEHLVAIDTPH